MPIPRWVAQANRAGFNRLARHAAPWLPGFGVIVHRGRRSGRTYQTPVNVFPAPDGFLVALTYGQRTDWVQNVMAARGAELRTRGRTWLVGSPHIYHDESRSGVPLPVRQILRRLRVADFLALKTERRL